MTSQTDSALDDDEPFIVVRRSRKKNWRHLRKMDEKVAKTSCYSEDQIPIEKIDAVMKSACSNTELIKYSEQVITLLLKSLSGRQLSSIWALGLGHFSRCYYSGCDQLAVLLHLQHYFRCEIHFQEPCLSETEKRWLCDRAICLSETKDLLECRILDTDDRDYSVVLFYAPHCGHAIYNSVIYAHRKKLNRIIIAGNNLHLMNLMSKNLAKCEGFVQNSEKCLTECNQIDLEMSARNELQALSLYSEACTLLEFPIFKSNFAVFNDTALHFLPENIEIPEISEARPEYRLFRHEIVV